MKKNGEYLHSRFQKGKKAYYRHDIEDVVMEFTPAKGKEGTKVKAKFKGRSPYAIEERTNLATEAFVYGHIITKEEYDKY